MPTPTSPQPVQAGDLMQLIYVSALFGPEVPHLANILASARRHNAEDGITGMLLYSNGNFLQVLEGPSQRVHATYDRIALDKRHHQLVTITEEPVERRHFQDWSMGFQRLGPDHAARFADQAQWFRYGFDADAIKAQPGVALELLQMFAQGQM